MIMLLRTYGSNCSADDCMLKPTAAAFRYPGIGQQKTPSSTVCFCKAAERSPSKTEEQWELSIPQQRLGMNAGGGDVPMPAAAGFEIHG